MSRLPADIGIDLKVRGGPTRRFELIRQAAEDDPRYIATEGTRSRCHPRSWQRLPSSLGQPAILDMTEAQALLESRGAASDMVVNPIERATEGIIDAFAQMHELLLDRMPRPTDNQ